MKKIISYFFLLTALIFTACSSDSDEIPQPTYLTVNYANIAGTWRLAEWNGIEMDEDRYCYLVINRKANADSGYRTLDMYHNMDSDKSRHTTSDYELSFDEDTEETTISGTYHHSTGFWTNNYVISQLSEDRMVWTVADDPSDVSTYVRCETVPEDVQAGTRSK